MQSIADLTGGRAVRRDDRRRSQTIFKQIRGYQ